MIQIYLKTFIPLYFHYTSFRYISRHVKKHFLSVLIPLILGLTPRAYASDLIAFWNFDSVKDGIAVDSQAGIAGFLLDGANFSGAGDGRTGEETDRSMVFGNGRQRMHVQDASFLNEAGKANAISISFWQNLSEIRAQTTIHANSATMTDALMTHTPWSNGVIYWDTAGCCNGDTQRVYVDHAATWVAKWNHVVLIKSGDLKIIYVNGVEVLSGTNTAPLPTDFTELFIGNSSRFAEAVGGSLDDVAIFKRKLTPSEVETLARGASPTSIDDDDSDQLPDSWELTVVGNLTDLTGNAGGPGPGPGTGDFDGDLLLDKDELVFGTNPKSGDTDGDRLGDGEEVGFGIFSAVDGVYTWEQARVDALAKGGRLAAFASSQEWKGALLAVGSNAFVNRLGVWIGASDQLEEGIWRWVTGEPFTFTNWAEGEPDNSNNSDYAEIAGADEGAGGKWYDRGATTRRDGYLLEKGYASSPLKEDSDNDGLSDAEEKAAGSHPLLADTDADGLADVQEVQLSQTSPVLADTDTDGQEDGMEDPDADGLTNTQEIVEFRTNPLLADSDLDGFNDLFELDSGFDPKSQGSTPDAVTVILPAVEFRFNAAAGVGYRIEGSNDLQNWTVIEPSVIGQGGVITRLYSIQVHPTRYIRVRRN